jgi:hypothetical protein
MFIKTNLCKSLVCILLLLNVFVQTAYSEDKSKMQQKGVIQSAKSVYVVTEPKSRTILVEAKKSSNSHVPFSFLSKLNPKNWSDYKTTIDSYSMILTDVKVKLDDGSLTIIPNLILRQTDFVKGAYSDKKRIQKYIVDGSPSKIYRGGRIKIKTLVTFYKEPEVLSRYTLNKKNKIDITVGNVEILMFKSIRQNDGSFKYSKNERYKKFLQYGLLALETHFDESEDKIKYSNLN